MRTTDRETRIATNGAKSAGERAVVAQTARRTTRWMTLTAAVALYAFWVSVAPASCFASEWRYAMDPSPQQIAPNAWRFSVNLGVRPAGQLQFASAEYDFAWPTQGVAVDYGFNGAGVDWVDNRLLYAVAPTLFDPIDGVIDGWNLAGVRDGIFNGVVYSTAPLTAVHFIIEADHLVPARRRH